MCRSVDIRIILKKPKEENSYFQKNPALFNELIELINFHPRSYSLILNAHGKKREPNIIPKHKHLNDWINDVTAFKLSNPFYTTPTKCYWILNDLHDFPCCAACGMQDEYKKRNVHIWNGYARNCSFKCRQNDIQTQLRKKNTCKKIYGVENPFQNEDVKNKCEQTKLEKYGDRKFTNIEKIKETKCCRKNEDPQYCKKINEKKIQSYLQHYGCKNPMQCPQLVSKMRKKYMYHGMMFDSSIEVAYFIWAQDNSMTIEKADVAFTYEFNGHAYHYIPDFFLPDTQQYVEIKGIQFFKSSDGTMMIPWRKKSWTDEEYQVRCQKEEAKHQCMIKNDVKIFLYPSKELNVVMNYIKQTYGKNYLKQFKYVKDKKEL